MSDRFDEQKYREIQAIWHQALKFAEELRYGTAIRLFEEGIRIATSPDYNCPNHLYELKRDLAEVLVRAGFLDRAVALFREVGIHYRIVRSYLKAGRAEDAVAACREGDITERYFVDALFAAGRDDEALDELNRMYSTLPLKKEELVISDYECFIALCGLMKRYGRANMESEVELLRHNYPRIVHDIEEHFENWKSALENFDLIHVSKHRKIIKQLTRPRKLPRQPELSCDENAVRTALASACTRLKDMKALKKAFNLACNGDYEKARRAIEKLRQRDIGFLDYSASDAFRGLLILEDRLDEALNWDTAGLRACGFQGFGLKMNLLFYTGKKLSGEHLAEYFKSVAGKQTNFLNKHVREFTKFCQDRLDDYEHINGTHLLKALADKSERGRPEYWFGMLFAGITSSDEPYRHSPFSKVEHPFIYFINRTLWQEVGDLIEGAENIIREQMGLPRIGEGWLSEAMVVNRLRELFYPREVQHQASPPWLDRQRFDAYVPSLNLAVEYQGEQHYQPIECFGGAEGLLATQERDAQKAKLAALNGVKIEYVRYDENIERQVDEIARKYLGGKNK